MKQLKNLFDKVERLNFKYQIEPTLEERKKYYFYLNEKKLTNAQKEIYCSEKTAKHLIGSAKKYFNKPKKKLTSLDLFILSNSIEKIFKGNINEEKIKIFAKRNKLNYFRLDQYFLIKKYLKKF